MSLKNSAWHTLSLANFPESLSKTIPLVNEVQKKPATVVTKESESWVPVGGHFNDEKQQRQQQQQQRTTPTKSLGIARIPGWRVERFTLALGEMLLLLLLESGMEEDNFEIVVETGDAGLERLTDVYVRFEREKVAEMVKVLSGRLLRVVGSGV